MRLRLALILSLVAAPVLAQDIPSPQFGTWGVDLSALDKSVKPGDNFFQYSAGNWLKAAVIAPDRSQSGAFQDLQILSERRMRAIIDDLEKKPEASLSPDERSLRDLYDAYEDTAAIEAAGLVFTSIFTRADYMD